MIQSQAIDWNVLQSLKAGAHNLLDFYNKVTTSETLISDYKVRSQVRNNVKSSLIMFITCIEPTLVSSLLYSIGK